MATAAEAGRVMGSDDSEKMSQTANSGVRTWRQAFMTDASSSPMEPVGAIFRVATHISLRPSAAVWHLQNLTLFISRAIVPFAAGKTPMTKNAAAKISMRAITA